MSCKFTPLLFFFFFYRTLQHTQINYVLSSCLLCMIWFVNSTTGHSKLFIRLRVIHLWLSPWKCAALCARVFWLVSLQKVRGQCYSVPSCGDRARVSSPSVGCRPSGFASSCSSERRSGSSPAASPSSHRLRSSERKTHRLLTVSVT